MEDRAYARLADVKIVDGRPFMDGGSGPLSPDREAGALCSDGGGDAQKEGEGLTAHGPAAQRGGEWRVARREKEGGRDSLSTDNLPFAARCAQSGFADLQRPPR